MSRDVTIVVTDAVSGANQYLSDGSIVKVATDTLGALVAYNDGGARMKYITVSETPAAVAALSNLLLDVTEASNNETVYINVNRLVKFDEVTISVGTDTLGSIILLDDGFARKYMTITEEPVQLNDRNEEM